jgi:hypothetical protein
MSLSDLLNINKDKKNVSSKEKKVDNLFVIPKIQSKNLSISSSDLFL